MAGAELNRSVPANSLIKPAEAMVSERQAAKKVKLV